MAKFQPWQGNLAAYNAAVKNPNIVYYVDGVGIYRGSVLIVRGDDTVKLTGNQLVAGVKTFANQIVSTVATGTSPLSVTSTTVVANLNADLLDGNHASAFALTGHTHNYATPAQLADGSVTRIGTATVGATNRPIYLNAGTPTVGNVGESFLTWGGQNFSASYGPIDAAMVPTLGANRTAFISASAVTVEYSRDGGTTWLDYGASDSTKIALFSGIDAGLKLGKNDDANKATADYKLRITLNTAGQVYTQLNKFVLLISTGGSTGCTCTIAARTQTNYLNSVNSWVTFSDHTPISGWSGFNVINTNNLTTYGSTPDTQYGQIQFLFEATGGSTIYNGLTLGKIYCYGGVGWQTPSSLAGIGTIYTYDTNKNVTFPAGVTAVSFTENGTVLASKYAGIAQTHYVGTTAIAANRSSASMALTGITSIDGSANSVAVVNSNEVNIGGSYSGSQLFVNYNDGGNFAGYAFYNGNTALANIYANTFYGVLSGKFAAARTIFGQSFDGTANVDTVFKINTGTTYTANMVAQVSGSINICNLNTSGYAMPGIIGKTVDNYCGLYLMSMSPDTNTNYDFMFNVRKPDNTDFSTLTGKKAFTWYRHGTELASLYRDGILAVTNRVECVAIRIKNSTGQYVDVTVDTNGRLVVNADMYATGSLGAFGIG